MLCCHLDNKSDVLLPPLAARRHVTDRLAAWDVNCAQKAMRRYCWRLVIGRWPVRTGSAARNIAITHSMYLIRLFISQRPRSSPVNNISVSLLTRHMQHASPHPTRHRHPLLCTLYNFYYAVYTLLSRTRWSWHRRTVQRVAWKCRHENEGQMQHNTTRRQFTRKLELNDRQEHRNSNNILIMNLLVIQWGKKHWNVNINRHSYIRRMLQTPTSL